MPLIFTGLLRSDPLQIITKNSDEPLCVKFNIKIDFLHITEKDYVDTSLLNFTDCTSTTKVVPIFLFFSGQNMKFRK